MPSKELSDHILKLTVIDAGKTKRRNVIGYVTFPMRDLPAESEQTLYKMDLEKVSAIVSIVPSWKNKLRTSLWRELHPNLLNSVEFNFCKVACLEKESYLSLMREAVICGIRL